MNKFNTNGIGGRRLVVGAHYGLKDWLIQRITAVIMAVFTLVLLIAFMCCTDKSLLAYEQWSGLFSNPAMQVITLLAWASLCYHAWIGIRDIWMDYVKPVGIRLTLHVFTALWLIGCVVYCAKILWRFA
jgi:succinate dehydrogenase / fumarate reductase membrane anchor subunit